MRFSLYVKAFKTALQAKLEYRSDFFLGILAALMLQAAGLGTLWVVLEKSPMLQGWSGWEVGLLFGLTSMIQGVGELLFNHIWYIPVFIVQGQIDRLLCYPVKSLPFFLLTGPEFHAFGNICGGLFVFSVCALKLDLPLWNFLFLPFWVACGTLVHTAFLVFCGALCFRVMGRKGQHFFMVNALLQASRYPASVYPQAFSFLILVIVPFSAVNYLPLGWMLGRFPQIMAFVVPLLAATVMTWMAFRVWEWGLKKYESTGS